MHTSAARLLLNQSSNALVRQHAGLRTKNNKDLFFIFLTDHYFETIGKERSLSYHSTKKFPVLTLTLEGDYNWHDSTFNRF